MKHRTTLTLLVLFATVLGVMGWLNYTHVSTIDPTSLLPSLIDVEPRLITRLEIDRGVQSATDKTNGRLVLTRQPDWTWQMVDPINTAADTNLVETLVKNLKEMRKSADAGTITDDPAKYGLDEPSAIVSLFTKDAKTPVAKLEIGKAAGERLYVRPGGASGIEVIDSRLVSALRLPTVDWRDKALFHMPSFQVGSLAIKDRASSTAIKVERALRHWRMVSPVRAPADDDKVEGLVAELSALRLIDGPDGFVADNVSDLSPYGLEKPELTIEIAGTAAAIKAQSLLFGKPVPDHPGQVYAKRGDQDDVIRVDTKILRESLATPTSLRSLKVVDLLVGRVVRLKIELKGKDVDVVRTDAGWQLLAPTRASADLTTVQSYLTKLTELQASEFLARSSLKDPGLDPPACRIRVWQVEPGGAASTSLAESTWASESMLQQEPAVDLKLGAHDLGRKTIYGQIAGDSWVLALPDKMAQELIPKSEFVFRDRVALNLAPAKVDRLTIEHQGRKVSVKAPGSGASSTHWRMAEPATGRADETAITALLTMLSKLHTDGWVTESIGNPAAWGFDVPRLIVRWEGEPPAADSKQAKTAAASSGLLRVGKKVPKGDAFYANVEGDPRVFTLTLPQVNALEVELRDKTVLAFAPERLEKITLHWPERTLAISRLPTAKGQPSEWQADPGYDPSGVDLSRFVTVAASLPEVKATRFLQDSGPIAAVAGLSPPRLVFELQIAGEPAPRWLALGSSTFDGQVIATTSNGSEGPVFVIPPNAAWTPLLSVPGRAVDLPANPFAPEPVRPTP